MKTKTTIYYHTFTFAYVLLVALTFCGCGDVNTTTMPTSKGGKVIIDVGGYTQVRKLNEFEYKGHTYISCNVRDGIAMTHAGHCKCNDKLKYK